MDSRALKTYSKQFQIFLSGFYMIGLALISDFCIGVNVFGAVDIIGLRKMSIICKVGACYTTLHYFLSRSKFDDLFINLNVGYNDRYPMYKGKKKTEDSVVYRFRIPAGVCVDDFIKHQQPIEQFLGHKVDIRYTYKEVEIEEFLTNEKELYCFIVEDLKGNVPILIGYDRRGNLIWCDLSKGEPHLLIGGETGSGKSTVLRAIISNLLLTSDVKLHLGDLKNGVEFRIFERCGNVIHFAKSISEISQMLNDLSVEVDSRYNLFYKADAVDINDYNKKFPKKKLDYHLLIIDEFADLQKSNECKDLLDELARKARACGIHMILCTQRPDKDVIKGSIKSNVTNVLGLKTLNSTNSGIILGEGGLEKLRGRGQGIFKHGGKLDKIQAPLLERDDAIEMIKHLYIEKVKKEVEAEVFQDISFADKYANF